MRYFAEGATALAAAHLLLGCSVIISPDESRLGGESPQTDAGTPPPETDGAVAVPCPRPPSCEGNVRVFCAGDALRRQRCPEDCIRGECTGAGGSWLPSNVDASQWDEGAIDLDLSAGTPLLDTTDCSGDVPRLRPVALERGEACVLSIGNFDLAAGVSLRIVGTRPLIVMAAGDVRIAGTLDASAEGTAAGAGGFGGGTRDEPTGQGPSAGEGGERLGRFDDGGGGGGGGCGAGGAGGLGGEAAGGAGGPAVASSYELVPLRGGSGGGRGGGEFGEALVGNAGLGGAGGGAIQISALGSIQIAGGAILAAGGGAQGGGDRLGSTMANWGSGGGGGAGGSILLEAPTIAGERALLNANGGGGGGGKPREGDGGDGEDGALRTERAGGGFGEGFGGAGGDGGGAEELAGDPGGSVTPPGQNGGGGGGGAGCILLRTSDGTSMGITTTPHVAPGVRTLTLRSAR